MIIMSANTDRHNMEKFINPLGYDLIQTDENTILQDINSLTISEKIFLLGYIAHMMLDENMKVDSWQFKKLAFIRKALEPN